LAVLQASQPVYPSTQAPAMSVSAPLVYPVESSQGPVLAPSTNDLRSRGYVQNLTPSHLQTLKVLEKSAPKTKFSERNNEMNFGRFMASMERAMDFGGGD
jgi:hypothetical protein